MSGRTRRAAVSAVALFATALSGCSLGGAAESRQVTVLAATSLTDAFAVIAKRFEAAHPGVHVRLSLAASSTLAQQIIDGAPADMLATADLLTMRQVRAAGLAAGQPAVFATNTPVVITPPNDPAGVASVEDLAEPDVAVALCAREVPCGRAATKLLRADRVSVTPVTLEPDVRSVLTKVRLGEVDAGIVYRTDARSAGPDVRTVSTRHAGDVVSRYSIAGMEDAGEPWLARQFVKLVLAPAGQRMLGRAGFGQP